MAQMISSVFVLAVFSLVWRQGNILQSGLPKPFELLIFLTAVLLLLSFRSLPSVADKMKTVLRFSVPFGIFFIFAALGNLNSALNFPEWQIYWHEVLAEYGRLIFVGLFFLLTAYLAFIQPSIIKKSLIAVAIAPLIFWFALLPSWQSKFIFEDERLRGAGNDPNIFGSFVMLALIISLAFFLYEEGFRRRLALLNVFLLFPLFIWAGSRSALLSFFAAFALLSLVYLIKVFSWPRFRSVSTGAAVLVLSFVFSFAILPQAAIKVFVWRFVPSAYVQSFGFSGAQAAETAAVAALLHQFDIKRIQIIWDSIDRLKNLPVGLGSMYHNWQPMGVLNGYKVGPHNSFLEVGLTAGYLGLAGWLVFLGGVSAKTFKLFRRDDPISMALAVSFFALMFFSFFVHTLTFRWLWLIMGFIVAQRQPPYVDITKSL